MNAEKVALTVTIVFIAMTISTAPVLNFIATTMAMIAEMMSMHVQVNTTAFMRAVPVEADL